MFEKPGIADLRKAAQQLGMNPSDDYLRAVDEIVGPLSRAYAALDGRLAGRRVALKDNICLAGVPMMIGADILEGYVPDVDATIVERILDAGGEIAGKAVCEYYCVSGGSHTSSTGP